MGKPGIYVYVILVLILAMPIVDTVYPSKLEDVSRTIPILTKSVLMATLAGYLIMRAKNWWFSNPIGGILTIFIFVYTFYLIISSDEYATDLYKLSKTLVWYFGFLVFLDLGYRRVLNDRMINIFFSLSIVFLLFMVLSTVTNEALFKSNRNYASSNHAYYLLFVFPYLFSKKAIKFRIILFTLITIGCVVSLKRGTLIAYALMVIYLLVFSNLGQVTGKRFANLLKVSVLLVITVVVMQIVLANLDIYTDKFSDFSELEEGGNIYKVGSGRGYLYLLPLERWINSNPFNFIFGYGFNATPDFYPTTGLLSKNFYAHSDVVMLIHDYGMVGLTLLFVFFKRLFRLARKPIIRSMRISLSLLFIVLLIKSAVSGFIRYDYSIFGFALLGLLLGEQRYHLRLYKMRMNGS